MSEKKIKGDALENMKRLVEGRGNSLDPRPVWTKDPRSIMEPAEPEPDYNEMSYMEDLLEHTGYDILGEED